MLNRNPPYSMSHLRKFLQIALLFLPFCIAKSEIATPTYLFTTEQNALGYAGWNGELNTWWNLGTLKISPTIALPVRLNFNSAQENIGASVVGWKWWFPLVESTAMKTDELNIRIRMPGGLVLKLAESSRIKNEFSDRNSEWLGKARENGDFHLRNQLDDTLLEFRKGHLSRIRLSDGSEIIWKYSASYQPLAIEDGEGKELLKLSYDTQGQLQKFEFNDEAGTLNQTQIGIHQITNNEGIQIPVLAKITKDDGSQIQFTYSFPDQESVIKIDFGGSRKNDAFHWMSDNGALISGGGLNYKATIDEGETFKFTRSKGTEFFDSYAFNPKTGEGILTTPEAIKTTRYIQTKGSAFNKISYYSEKRGDYESSTKKYYDAEGTLTKETTDGSNTYYLKSISDLNSIDLHDNDQAIFWPSPQIQMIAYSEKGTIKTAENQDLYGFDFHRAAGGLEIKNIFSFRKLNYLEENLTLTELIRLAIEAE